MNLFMQRLKEPTSWAGLAVLGMMFGLNPHIVAAVGQVATVLAPLVPSDGGGIAQAIIGAAAGLAIGLPQGAQAAQAAPAPAPAPAAPVAAAPVAVAQVATAAPAATTAPSV